MSSEVGAINHGRWLTVAVRDGVTGEYVLTNAVSAAGELGVGPPRVRVMKRELPWMLRLRCLNLEKQPHGWTFAFEKGINLKAECPWRIIIAGRIALGSVDDGEQFGLPTPVDAQVQGLALLTGRCIQGAEISPGSGDLILRFADDCRLELFNNSSGYEGWCLVRPDRQQVIALGGGEISTFPGEGDVGSEARSGV